MREPVSETTKRITTSAMENMGNFAEQIYKEARGLKDCVVSLAPEVRKYTFPSNPADICTAVIIALPSAGYLIEPSEAMLKTISAGLLFYAILTPARIEEYNARKIKA